MKQFNNDSILTKDHAKLNNFYDAKPSEYSGVVERISMDDGLSNKVNERQMR